MIWWTKSWNPVIGCTKCSPACDNCYAERLHTQRHTAKLAGAPMQLCYAEPFDRVRFLPERLQVPLHWRKPQRIFVGNMGDLFHADVPFEALDRIFAVMALCPQHTFMLCTKRPERMREYFETENRRERVWLAIDRLEPFPTNWPLPNVWLGTTIWDQPSADRAVPILLDTPAAKRFVSVEPMLGPVDLTPWLPGSYECALSCGHREGAASRPEVRCVHCGFQGSDAYEVWGDGNTEVCPECGKGETEPVCPECGTYMVQEHPDTQYLDWVICGGETGPGARPMHPDWVRSLRDQCQAAEVPFFFKQWGEWAPWEFEGTDGGINKTGGSYHYKVDSFGKGEPRRFGARKAGRVLDGRTWEEVPHAR